MKALEINLASRPYRNDLPLALLLGLAIALSFGLTAKNVYTYITADSRLADLDQELADHQRNMERIQAEAESLQKELDAVDLEILEPQAEFANAVLQERNFSWTLFFNALEDVLPWHTRLTSIRPHFDSGRVVIEVNATSQNYDGFLEFQRVLQASPYFDQVLPTGFETGKGGDHRVYFSLNFTYDPQALMAPAEAGQGDRVAGVETIVIGEDGEEAAGGKADVPSTASGSREDGIAGQPELPGPTEPEALGAPREAASGGGAGRATGGGASREGEVRTGRRRKGGKRGVGPRSFKAGSAGADAGSGALLPRPGARGASAAADQAPLVQRPRGPATASSPSGAANSAKQTPGTGQAGEPRRKMTDEELEKWREDHVVYDKNGVPRIVPQAIEEGSMPQIPKAMRDLLPPGHPAKGDSGQDTSGSPGQEESGGGESQSGSGSSGSGSGGGQP